MALSRTLTLFVLMTTPLSAFAHPGHGGLFAGFAHPFAGLDHVAAMLAVGLVAARFTGRARWALPGGFVLAALAGAVLGFDGIALPGLETGVAVSVAVLGMALVWRLGAGWPGSARPVGLSSPTYGTAMLAALIAAFGLFHGNAHALEASGNPAGFVAGFVAGTAILHGFGLAVGARMQTRIVRAAGVALTALGGWLVLGSLA